MLSEQAVERRRKLDRCEDDAYWLCTKKRRGHGLSEDGRRIVHDFYVAHPSIKRSPIKSDVLKIKDEHGVVQDVPKLLSEVSLTDVYLDMNGRDNGALVTIPCDFNEVNGCEECTEGSS